MDDSTDGTPGEIPAASLVRSPRCAGRDVRGARNDAEPSPEPAGPTSARVGWGFLLLFWLAWVGLWVPILAPVVITLALKVNATVGPDRASSSLGVVVGVGALFAMVSSPFFGRLSDATTSRLGMRRPWILFGLVGGGVACVGMALAPSVAWLTLAFAGAQCLFNAATAAMLGVLADQVPPHQRGLASGLFGAAAPVALPVATFLVQLVAPNQILMFLVPLAVGIVPMLLFLVVLDDRRLAPADKPAFSWRGFFGAFWVSPVQHRDYGLAWWGRFFFVFAYATVNTYQIFYLMNELNKPASDVPKLIFQSTLVLSSTNLISCLAGGKVSDVLRRRKIFVVLGSVIFGAGLFVITGSATFTLFLVGMGIAGLGVGSWTAVDTALFVDLLPSESSAGKDLAVANIAATLPQSLAPATAPLILAVAGGSYAVLYTVAGALAVLSTTFVLLIKRVR